jgi:hypothetical protein
MPCRPDEYESQRLDAPDPVTPTKSLRNYGAGHDNMDSAESDDDEGEEEEPVAPKKGTRVLAQYMLVKRWVTGELAEMDEEGIENELLVEAHELMQISRLKKLSGHKGLETELHLWKRAGGDHATRAGITYTIYLCPMSHQCDCNCTIRVGRGVGSLTLELFGIHDMKSHATDKSKYLKYDQIISLSEAAVTAPNLSEAVIRRNLLMHDRPTKTIGVQHRQRVSRRVRRARKNMTVKQLCSVIMDDGFGALTEFCSRRAWPELVRKHNDQTDDYHLSLY